MKRFTVDSPAMNHWRKYCPEGFRGTIRLETPRIVAERVEQQTEGLDDRKLAEQALAQILAMYPGARVVARIHDEVVIEVDGSHVQR